VHRIRWGCLHLTLITPAGLLDKTNADAEPDHLIAFGRRLPYGVTPQSVMAGKPPQ
jgi:hypothetical protein